MDYFFRMSGREEVSILEMLGVSTGGSCGYCKDEKGRAKESIGENEEEGGRNGEEESRGDGTTRGQSIAIGAWAHTLNVADYQRLLDRGWRRSGSYLYKPKMDVTCCPQYTIRLDVDKFRLSKSHKRLLNNIELYLQKDKQLKAMKEDSKEGKNDGVNSGDGEKKKKREEKGEKKEEGQMKKKTMRRNRAIEKWKRKGLDVEKKQEERRLKELKRIRGLEERIGQGNGEGWSHSLNTQLVSVNSPEYDERADESYELFKKYQNIIHKDFDVNRRGFERFLVKSPLTSASPLLGSFHLRYLLDGRLLAVGVMDILPHSLSSKYLFYDPDYSFLSLGTYTALREIALVRKLREKIPALKYYYMGFYIDDCPKMRYKGKMRPSDLLCDRTFTWIPLSEASSLISSNQGLFTVFRPNDPSAPSLSPLHARLYRQGGITSIDRLTDSMKAKVRPRLTEICQLVPPSMDKVVLVSKELQDEEEDE